MNLTQFFAFIALSGVFLWMALVYKSRYLAVASVAWFIAALVVLLVPLYI